MAAVEPRRLVRAHLEELDEALGDRVRVVAFGKAAAAMAAAAVEALGARIAGGVAIVPAGQEGEVPAPLLAFGGGHPVPNEEGVAGAAAIEALAREARAEDHLLCLISGGGSALMTLPPEGVGLADLQTTTDRLLRAGATIRELNAVRKHLDRLKGGRLAAAAAPASLTALVLSDVVGDPLDVIASGPASPDPTTFAEALAAVARHGVLDELPVAVREHLEAGARGERAESPGPDDPCFRRVRARVIGSNRLAVQAARAEADRRGYETLVLTTVLTGEAREAGAFLAAVAREASESGRPVAAPACLLAAGETTVRVTGGGRGGRNQEVALGAARRLGGGPPIVVLSLGTDGVDGPTDAAGAVGAADTLERAAGAGLDAEAALAENDAYPFFRALGDLVIIGPTGTNVMDLQVVLVS